MPLTFVLRLQISLKKKVGLCILLGLGVVSGVCVVIKTILLRNFNVQTDETWVLVTAFSWHSSEIFLNIICGSIPTLPPLFDKFTKGKPIRPSKVSGSSSRKSSQPRAGTRGSPYKPWTRTESCMPMAPHDEEQEDILLDNRSIALANTFRVDGESVRGTDV